MRSLMLAAAFLSAACARTAGDMPDIHYGRDACARCGMTIGQDHFAAGYVGADGETVAFDDLGEYLAAAAEEPSLSSKAYVQDAQDGRWLRASQAVIVLLPGLPTPMGSGYAAFASQAEAKAFTDRLASR